MSDYDLLEKYGFTNYGQVDEHLVSKYPSEVDRLTEEGFLLVLKEYDLKTLLEGSIPFRHYKLSKHDMQRGDTLRLPNGMSTGTCIGSIYDGSVVKVV
jgi:hypothetical protein